MNVAVVGGGPAGSLLAFKLARDGARPTLFDASHPREKPCGGGVTAKALALLPAAPASDPSGPLGGGLPVRGGGREAVAGPYRAVAVARAGWRWMSAARRAGARHGAGASSRSPDRLLRTTKGRRSASTW